MNRADRQRRYRQRQRRGLRTYRVELPDRLVEQIIGLRKLTDQEAQEQGTLESEFAAMIAEYARLSLRVTPRG